MNVWSEWGDPHWANSNLGGMMMMSILLLRVVYTIRISICNNYTTYVL